MNSCIGSNGNLAYTVHCSFHLNVSKTFEHSLDSTEWGTVWFRCVADIRWAQSPFHGGRHTMPPSICLHDSEYRNDSATVFNNSLDIWGLFAHQHHCTLSRAVVTFSNTLNVNASNHKFKDLDNDINVSATFLKCLIFRVFSNIWPQKKKKKSIWIYIFYFIALATKYKTSWHVLLKYIFHETKEKSQKMVLKG